MTELVYLTDSYKKELRAKVVSVKQKGQLWFVVLDKTIFYPEGGGQPSDKGEIIGKKGTARVKHVRLSGTDVVHECVLDGTLAPGDSVTCFLDWDLRYHNMRVHSAGHIVHEAVMHISPYLVPLKGNHADAAFIEYTGSITQDKKYQIEQQANDIVTQNLTQTTQFVTLEELKKRASYVPQHLPVNKPLRIVTITGFEPLPDGGTQVAKTAEVGPITISDIENADQTVRVHYAIEQEKTIADEATGDATSLIAALLDVEKETIREIQASNQSRDELKIKYLGRSSELSKLTGQLGSLPKDDRGRVGIVANQVKKHIEETLEKETADKQQETSEAEWFDPTMPGDRPPLGHLHIVTQAITEITRIFERLGFTRVRHPEVDWDWYAFESLNMPPDHPARDEWETFFINYTGKKKMVLTPHTSNGQVREMEKKHLPIRMINIAKCYRRQSDVSHTPMFHQFEGLFVDKNVSIGDLKGVMDYFFKSFYGPERKSRLRPFHFQFTEPSFEVDVNCGVCLGKARLPDGQGCKLCKEGWLELGGAGMVHPNVLKAGGIDPDQYNGFAFGWGVERVAMMKSGTQLDDIRLLYGNDVRFLEQF